jgi:hypothetical protein
VPLHVVSLFCPTLHFCHISPVLLSVTVPLPWSVYDLGLMLYAPSWPVPAQGISA